jgi:hypothetical protein
MAQIHDGFSFVTVMWLEALGLLQEGQGIQGTNREPGKDSGREDVARLPAAACLGGVHSDIPVDTQVLTAVNRVQRGLRSMPEPKRPRAFTDGVASAVSPIVKRIRTPESSPGIGRDEYGDPRRA